MIFLQTRFPPTLSEWSNFVQCESHGTVHRLDERCLECRVDDLEKELEALMGLLFLEVSNDDLKKKLQDLEGGK